MFLEQQIRTISERSCDSEDWKFSFASYTLYLIKYSNWKQLF